MTDAQATLYAVVGLRGLLGLLATRRQGAGSD